MNFENTNLFNVCNQLFKSLFKGGHFVVETGWKAHVFDRKYVIAVEIRLLRVDSKLFRSRTRTRSLLIHCYLPSWMHKWQSAYNYEVSLLRYFDWYILMSKPDITNSYGWLRAKVIGILFPNLFCQNKNVLVMKTNFWNSRLKAGNLQNHWNDLL